MRLTRGKWKWEARPQTTKKGKPGALKPPLCAGSEEGPDHKGLLYADNQRNGKKKKILFKKLYS